MPNLCHIKSVPITKSIGSIDTEDGFFECTVHVSLDELSKQSDPKGFCDNLIARSLHNCRIESGLPLREDLWLVTFTQWARKSFNYPEGFTT